MHAKVQVQERMSNPAPIVPGALRAPLGLDESTRHADIPNETGNFVHLRQSDQRLRRLR